MNPKPRSETIFLTVPFGIYRTPPLEPRCTASACSREKNTGRTRDRPKSGRPAVVYHDRVWTPTPPRRPYPSPAGSVHDWRGHGCRIGGGLRQFPDLGWELTEPERHP